MLKFLLPLLIAAAPLAASAPATNAPATHAPSTNAPAAATPSPIAVGDVVTQAQIVAIQLQADRIGLSPDQTVQALEDKLPPITQAIDDRVTADAPLVEGNGSLTALQNSQLAWQGIIDDLDSAQKDLSVRVRQLDALLWQLTQQEQTWKPTHDAATKTAAPPEMLQ